jgi:hypothetical protein
MLVRWLASVVCGWIALQPAGANATCPPPATTTSAVTCPAGSRFNPYGKCEVPNLAPCPAGYTYVAGTNKCEIVATLVPAESCPAGYAYDAVTGVCGGAASSACALGSWGYYEQTCVSGTELPGWFFDAEETGLWIGPWSCPPAYAVNRWNGACSGPKVTAVCPAGTTVGRTVSSTTVQCEAPAAAPCAAGQTYNPWTTKCEFAPPMSGAAPTCPPGYVLNVDTNVCAGAGNSACPPGSGWGWYEQACTSMEPLPGFGWDDETGQYCGGSSCPAGFALNRSWGSCSGAPCQAGYAWDAAASSCQPLVCE